MQKKVKKTAKNTECTFFRAFLICLPIQIITAVILLLISARLCLMLEDPAAFVIPVSLVCMGVSCFVGGFSGARMYKNSWVLVGFCLGLSFLGLSFVLSLTPLYKGASDILSRSALCAVVVLFSLIGARSGAQKSTAKRKFRSA